MTEDFIAAQAGAWCQIVADMRKDPLFAVINGGSVNGPGSSLEYTKGLREQLPVLMRDYRVATVLDAPCGDMTWIKNTDLSGLLSYIGMDVDADIIDTNRRELGHYTLFAFIRTNLLTRRRFPNVDLILCRDFLAHLTTEYITVMIDKYKASGSTYLLASNYPGADNAFDYDAYRTVECPPWDGYLERPHDLTAAPFHLTRVDGIAEQSPPGGIIAREHELALFTLQGVNT